MRKIWLDTDIGSDIDDALALAYLAGHPQCELLGVSTVSGQAERRAQMASAILTHAGKANVPIYPGAENPLIIGQKQPVAAQADALCDWTRQQTFARGEALIAMRHAIRQNPGEVTLLGIGPMTNIALLFAMDPDLPAMLEQLVIMCGIFTYGLKAYTCLSEWNSRCDPHASAMVYAAPVPIVRSIGLDVTTQVVMPAGELRERLTAPIARPVLDFMAARTRSDSPVTFHDPLAAVDIFEPDICGYKTGSVEVELDSKRLEGLTWLADDPAGNDRVATMVDADEFFRCYFSVVGDIVR